MTKSQEFFRSLFDDFPNISILNINNGCSDIQKLLEQIVNDLDGKLTVKNFEDIDEKRFRLTAREYEYAVVCDCVEKLQDADRFIQEVYHSLENSANIIVISKKENSDIYALTDILDRNDFRAVNQIDIFDKFHLVTGKKMHMWGNGL